MTTLNAFRERGCRLPFELLRIMRCRAGDAGYQYSENVGDPTLTLNTVGEMKNTNVGDPTSTLNTVGEMKNTNMMPKCFQYR